MIIRILMAFFAVFLSQSALAEPSFAETENKTCFMCHKNPSSNVFVDEEVYSDSEHAKLSCTNCHKSEQGKMGFMAIPHKDATIEKNCQNCHASFFNKEVGAVKGSVHAMKFKEGEELECTTCHNPHKVQKADSLLRTEEQLSVANDTCLDCHNSEEKFNEKSAEGRELGQLDMAHTKLPSSDKHFAALRCVDCHSPADSTNVHSIMPASEVTECRDCHQEGSALLKKRFKLDPEKQNVNDIVSTDSTHERSVAAQDFFKGRYMPGTLRIQWLDTGILFAILGLFLAVCAHGLGRYLTRHKLAKGGEEHKEYLLPLPVRIWHWVNAVAFIVLLATGAGFHFAFGDMQLQVLLHNNIGLVLAGSWVGFVIITLVSGGRHYWPELKGLMGRIQKQRQYYLGGIFRGEDHPFHATTENRFNPLQQLGYMAVMFGLVPALIVSGLLMMWPEFAPAIIADWVPMAHYLLAAGSVLFLVFHLYLITTGDRPTSLLKSMIDGYHRGRKH